MNIEDKISKYLTEKKSLKEDFDVYGISSTGGMEDVPEPVYDENSFENDLFDKMSELIYSLDESFLDNEQITLRNEIIEDLGDNIPIDDESVELDDYSEFYNNDELTEDKLNPISRQIMALQKQQEPILDQIRKLRDNKNIETAERNIKIGQLQKKARAIDKKIDALHVKMAADRKKKKMVKKA